MAQNTIVTYTVFCQPAPDAVCVKLVLDRLAASIAAGKLPMLTDLTEMKYEIDRNNLHHSVIAIFAVPTAYITESLEPELLKLLSYP